MNEELKKDIERRCKEHQLGSACAALAQFAVDEATTLERERAVKRLEQVLQNKIKLISDGEHTYIGTPQELMDDFEAILTDKEVWTCASCAREHGWGECRLGTPGKHTATINPSHKL